MQIGSTFNVKNQAKYFYPYFRRYIEYFYGHRPLLIKYSHHYYVVRNLLRQSQFWSFDEFRAFQFKNLKKIVNYSWKHIPGYTDFWEEHKFSPENLKSLEDIKRIPFITKNRIKRNLEKFSNKKINSKIFKTSTGGSTGTPLTLYMTKQNHGVEWAFISDQWSRVGFKNRDKIARIRGDIVDNKSHVKYDPISRRLIISSYHLTSDYLPRFIDRIRQYKPAIIHAYPSSAYAIAKYLDRNNEYLNIPLKAVMLGSEKLYEKQKKLIHDRFKARCFSWYGLNEKCVLAGYCEKTDLLHIYPQYGITEILDDEDKDVKEGGSGKIVGTSFWMKATPLIRYVTGDLATVGGMQCKECGRKYPLLQSIDGRIQEYIVDKSGNKITCTGMYYLGTINYHISDIQLHQDKPGFVNIHVATSPCCKDYSAINHQLKQEFSKRYGNDFNISIKFVEWIQKSQSGKELYVIQNIQ